MPHQMGLYARGIRRDAELQREMKDSFDRLFLDDEPEVMAKLGLIEYEKLMISARFGAHLMLRNSEDFSMLTAEPGWSLGRIAAWVRTVAEKTRADRYILTCVANVPPLAISNSREKIPMVLGIAEARHSIRPYIHGKRMTGDGVNIETYDGLADDHIADLDTIGRMFTGLLPWKPVEPHHFKAAEAA